MLKDIIFQWKVKEGESKRKTEGAVNIQFKNVSKFLTCEETWLYVKTQVYVRSSSLTKEDQFFQEIGNNIMQEKVWIWKV